MSIIDGDEKCKDCSRCCSVLDGLVISNDELDRLPAFKDFITASDDRTHTVHAPDGCPYLDETGWCGVFDERPFDCSLFPIQLGEVRRTLGSETSTVGWRWGGAECPSREAFIAEGAPTGFEHDTKVWLQGALGSEEVNLRRSSTRKSRTLTAKQFLKGLRGRVSIRSGTSNSDE